MAALDGYTIGQLQSLSAPKLTALVIDKVATDGGVRADLSYIGSFYAASANVAAQRACKLAGVQSLTALEGVAEALVAKVVGLIRQQFPAIAGSIAAEVGAGMADVIPLVGAVAGAILDMNNAAKRQNDAKAVADCRAYYVAVHGPNGLVGSGIGPMGVEVRPCDILQQSDNGGISDYANARRGPTTVGAVFALADQAYAASGGYTPYKLKDPNAGPGSPYTKATIHPQPGIPTERKRLLAALRLAIAKSYLDSNTDGGVALWPIYLDLLWKEHERGSWNYSQVWYEFGAYILSPLNYTPYGAAASERRKGECLLFEDRGYREFKAIMTSWSLTLSPIYVQDRARADALRETIAAAEAKLLAAGTVAGLKLSSSALATVLARVNDKSGAPQAPTKAPPIRRLVIPKGALLPPAVARRRRAVKVATGVAAGAVLVAIVAWVAA